MGPRRAASIRAVRRPVTATGLLSLHGGFDPRVWRMHNTGRSLPAPPDTSTRASGDQRRWYATRLTPKSWTAMPYELRIERMSMEKPHAGRASVPRSMTV